MITWLQRVLQRHYKWLFSIMLIIIIIAFVFTVGAAPGISDGRSKNKSKLFYGYNLTSQYDVEYLTRNASISHWLNTGDQLSNSPLAEELALSRPPLLYLANQLEIPKPDNNELIQYIKSKPIFKDLNNTFDPNKYNDFLNAIDSHPSYTQDEIRNALAEDYQIDQVNEILSGPGYILPYEAQQKVVQQKTKWSLEVASLEASKLNSNIFISEEDLKNFYEQNKMKYASPEKVKVNYAFFPASNYASQVKSPSDQDLEDFYDKNITLFIRKYNGDSLPNFDSIKDSVLETYKNTMASRLAAEAANDFILDLYEHNVTYKSQEFYDLLNKNKIVLKQIPPFSKKDYPKDLGIPLTLLDEAFNLNESQFYSDIAKTDNGTFVLIFEERLPISIPSLDSLSSKLKAEFITQQNLKLLDIKGKVLEKTFKKEIKEGKKFPELAHQEGLAVKSYDNFTMGTPPKELDSNFLIQAQSLNTGDVSSMILTDDVLYFIYIKNKEKPTVDSSHTEVTALIKELSDFTSKASARSYVHEMINQAIKK